eukprot:scaffold8631_cov75-Cylindrotheca_fusiformis.AAC.1
MHGVLFHMLKGMPLLQHQDLENKATTIEASRTPSAGRSFIHRTDPLSKNRSAGMIRPPSLERSSTADCCTLSNISSNSLVFVDRMIASSTGPGVVIRNSTILKTKASSPNNTAQRHDNQQRTRSREQ